MEERFWLPADYKGKAADRHGNDDDLRWLRGLRNQLIHVMPPGTPSQMWKLPAENFGACLAALEPVAQRAIRLVYRDFYKTARRC